MCARISVRVARGLVLYPRVNVLPCPALSLTRPALLSTPRALSRHPPLFRSAVVFLPWSLAARRHRHGSQQCSTALDAAALSFTCERAVPRKSEAPASSQGDACCPA